jgi:hypothetical protein
VTAAQGGPSWCVAEDLSQREFSISIDPGLAIVNASMKPGTIGQPYSEALTAKEVVNLNPLTGADVLAVWSVQSGALPPGITLSAQGILVGTPTAEGSWQFVVHAQKGNLSDTETYTIAVRQQIVIGASFTTPSGRSEVGAPYRVSFSARGGSGTFTWALTSGSLPSGVVFAPQGTISGTPTTAGSFPYTVSASDSEGRTAIFSETLNVAAKLTIKTRRLKPAKIGRLYRAKLATAGGVQPVSWRILRGQLPRGVRFAKKLGILAGTPRRVGTFRLTAQARDPLGVKAQKTLVLLVKA